MMMIREYKLIGLGKPSSATLELDKGGDSFWAKYEYPQSLWDYCKNNWKDTNLKAIIECDKLASDGTPINAIVLRVEPI